MNATVPETELFAAGLVMVTMAGVDDAVGIGVGDAGGVGQLVEK